VRVPEGPRASVFDMDGVLVDSEPHHRAAWCRLCDVRLGKPDPEVYATVAARLQVAPSACVVFEDALVGVVAARPAGMSVGTTCSEATLRGAGARMVVTDFTEVTWRQVTTPP